MVGALALGRARLAGAALVLAALAVPSASSGSQLEQALTVSGLHTTAVWNQGWLTGSVRFSVTVPGASTVSVSIRPVAGGAVAAHKSYSFTSSGTFTETIKLPARLAPKAYDLKASSGSSASDDHFTVPSPPEGVVDTAAISSAKGGKIVHVLASPHQLWVRFHFLVPPKAKTVKVVWRTPSYTFVGAATKPYAATIDSFVASGSALPHGTWYAILMVDGKTAKKIDVRVT